jgi:hypothetical protein
MVGWYRFVRGRPLTPSFSETIIHKKLMKRCRSTMPFTPDHLILLLMSAVHDDAASLSVQLLCYRCVNDK